jgi:hypothetical protein
VLAVVGGFEGKPLDQDDQRWLAWPDLQRWHCDAIYDAWRDEVNPRRTVQNTA